MTTSLGIIGAGNMGEAFIGAVLGAKLFAPSQVWVSDVSEARLGFISTTYGIRTTQDNAALFHACDIVILAVKPQQMDMILKEIAPRNRPRPGEARHLHRRRSPDRKARSRAL